MHQNRILASQNCTWASLKLRPGRPNWHSSQLECLARQLIWYRGRPKKRVPASQNSVPSIPNAILASQSGAVANQNVWPARMACGPARMACWPARMASGPASRRPVYEIGAPTKQNGLLASQIRIVASQNGALVIHDMCRCNQNGSLPARELCPGQPK